MRILLKLLPVVLLASCATGADSPPAETVAQVDISRFMGRWQEIARLPNDFQDQCVADASVDYTLRDDGRIDVVHRCRNADGEMEVVRGIARVQEDEPGNAKLEVSFFDIFGWRPSWDDYWIIGLERGYDWAVVGHPDRKHGWILSRASRLTDTTRERIDRLLREHGYDPEDFIEKR